MKPVSQAKRLLRGVRTRVVHGPTWLAPPRARRVPACPEGWRTAPPDFVGIGAQKAGTSWWDALVQAHPDVHRPPGARPKELHYFAPYWHRPFTDEAVRDYAEFFPRPEGGLAGEWTPRYMADFWTPALLARVAPEAKLLVLLRDPIDRYLSGITFNASHGAPRHPVIALESAWRGLYHAQLSNVLEHFPRERVLVQQYERCRTDPDGEIARTYRFLGLDPTHVPTDIRAHVNRTEVSKEETPDEVIAALQVFYERDTAQLLEAFPEIDGALWRSTPT